MAGAHVAGVLSEATDLDPNKRIIFMTVSDNDGAPVPGIKTASVTVSHLADPTGNYWPAVPWTVTDVRYDNGAYRVEIDGSHTSYKAGIFRLGVYSPASEWSVAVVQGCCGEGVAGPK